MKTRGRNFLIFLIFIALIAAALAFFFWEDGDEDDTLTLWGNIDIREVNVGFRVFGRLKEVFFEEGDPVEKGKLLATLDEGPYVENLKEARARYVSQKESLKLAADQLKRRSNLVEDKSVSQEDYDKAFYQQKILEANVQEAFAALQNAKIQLEDTKLSSPTDGVIYTRVREPGTVLTVGEPVYSIAPDAPIWARTYISEPELGLIYPGMPAEIYTDTPENPVYQGHVGFISPIAEFTPKNVETPDLRTSLVYQLRIIIENPDRGLRRGMPVTIKLLRDDDDGDHTR